MKNDRQATETNRNAHGDQQQSAGLFDAPAVGATASVRIPS